MGPAGGEFSERTEPFRGELLAHCYRMVGSFQDAEDLVQETYLRAWRSFDGFEGRSSLRTWLYQIATNRCLTALEQRGRRVLPSGLGGPSPDPGAELEPGGPGVSWLEPAPTDPADVLAGREDLRLALVASWQHLPPLQRAVLLLREVLAFSAAEVADLLGTTTPAVKSALQRARARLDQLALDEQEILEPDDPQARELLRRYVEAFQNSDAAALERLLVADATLEATPFRTWFAGVGTCVPFLRDHLLGASGTWRLSATSANGQPAAVVHVRDAQGVDRPYGICVLTVVAAGIRRITSFGDPALVAVFDSFAADSFAEEPGSHRA